MIDKQSIIGEVYLVIITDLLMKQGSSAAITIDTDQRIDESVANDLLYRLIVRQPTRSLET